MTVEDLIKKLSEFDKTKSVYINLGGYYEIEKFFVPPPNNALKHSFALKESGKIKL